MQDPIVSVRDLCHTYLADTLLATPALRGAQLTIGQGETVGLVGRSGAGKSTLVRFLNGLLRPRDPGHVVVFGEDTALPSCDLPALRCRVGLVFQQPHLQLLERYVGDDIAYGPRQLGLSREELLERVRWAMLSVGLDFEAFVDRHTFSLSGGEMRRVALAGVLAMRPELLVLDEATTGLDPQGRIQIHALLKRLKSEGVAVLIVSNDMDEVASLVDSVAVLDRGRTVLEGPTRAILAGEHQLEEYGLEFPSATRLARELHEAGVRMSADVLTSTEAEEAIWQALAR